MACSNIGEVLGKQPGASLHASLFKICFFFCPELSTVIHIYTHSKWMKSDSDSIITNALLIGAAVYQKLPAQLGWDEAHN